MANKTWSNGDDKGPDSRFGKLDRGRPDMPEGLCENFLTPSTIAQMWVCDYQSNVTDSEGSHPQPHIRYPIDGDANVATHHSVAAYTPKTQ
jgi:hypothetical protein